MTQRLRIGCAHLQRGRIQCDRHVLMNRDQQLRQARFRFLRQQCFTRPLLRDLLHVRENVFERTELRDELLRPLLADSFHTGHVVRRITHQREIVDDPLGRHAEPIVRVLDAHPLLFHAGWTTAAGIEQPHAGAHELLEVLVARHDHHVVPGVHPFSRERADHIVGFKARHREHRNGVGREQLIDALKPPIEVGLQLIGELLTRRLVFGIQVVAKRGARVMHPAQQLRLVRYQQSLEERRNPPGGRRVFAVTRGKRSRHQREKRAVDQGIAIDQEQTRCGGTLHLAHCRDAMRRRIALSSSARPCVDRRQRPNPV